MLENIKEIDGKRRKNFWQVYRIEKLEKKFATLFQLALLQNTCFTTVKNLL